MRLNVCGCSRNAECPHSGVTAARACAMRAAKMCKTGAAHTSRRPRSARARASSTIRGRPRSLEDSCRCRCRDSNVGSGRTIRRRHRNEVACKALPVRDPIRIRCPVRRSKLTKFEQQSMENRCRSQPPFHLEILLIGDETCAVRNDRAIHYVWVAKGKLERSTATSGRADEMRARHAQRIQHGVDKGCRVGTDARARARLAPVDRDDANARLVEPGLLVHPHATVTACRVQEHNRGTAAAAVAVTYLDRADL
jgi:hypothetical protein